MATTWTNNIRLVIETSKDRIYVNDKILIDDKILIERIDNGEKVINKVYDQNGDLVLLRNGEDNDVEKLFTIIHAMI